MNFLKQNLNVVVISLEMSQDVYAQRFDAHISGGDINGLRDNSTSIQEKIKKFYADHPKANLFIKEYPPDINDPVDGDFKVYDACFCEIRRCLKKVKAILEEKSLIQ